MKKLLATLAAGAICAATAIAQNSPSGTLPVMYITTAGNAPIESKENYVDATYYLDPMGCEGIEDIGSKEQQEAMQIRGRGNWTWVGFDKKPYRIKLAEKTALMGCEKSKHFALLAHADDNKGFLRNAVGFELSRLIGLPWTPEDKPLEVILNGEYIGLYFLTETIRVDKKRVNIVEQTDNNNDPSTISGGWLVEIDNYFDDPHIEITEGDGETIVFTYKTPEALSEIQAEFLRSQMQQINEYVYADDTDNCQWATMVDLDILAKYYIVQEIVDNYEAFHGSCYLYRQLGDDEKWNFGPVWDFGSTFNHDKNQYIYEGREHHQTWIGHMCRFPEFTDIVEETWKNFVGNSLNDIYTYIDAYSAHIAEAAKADARRWPQYGNNDEAAKAAQVKDYIRHSAQWLCTQWGGEIHGGDDTYTVYFRDNAATPWETVKAFVWGADEYTPLGGWPGSDATLAELGGEPTWSISFTPDRERLGSNPGLIFDNGHSGVEAGNQTIDLPLINNGLYNRDGYISQWSGIIDDNGIVATATPYRIITAGQGRLTVAANAQYSLRAARIDGTTVVLELAEGISTFALPRGIYIIDGRKYAL